MGKKIKMEKSETESGKENRNISQRHKLKALKRIDPLDKQTLIRRRWNKFGFEVRTVEVDDSDFGGDGKLPMKLAYNPSGEWIGDPKTVLRLAKKYGIRIWEKRTPSSCVCTIGFSPETQKWHGWSHRAICGFEIGMYEFNCIEGKLTPKIETLSMAKDSARRFARSVN